MVHKYNGFNVSKITLTFHIHLHANSPMFGGTALQEPANIRVWFVLICIKMGFLGAFLGRIGWAYNVQQLWIQVLVNMQVLLKQFYIMVCVSGIRAQFYSLECG